MKNLFVLLFIMLGVSCFGQIDSSKKNSLSSTNTSTENNKNNISDTNLKSQKHSNITPINKNPTNKNSKETILYDQKKENLNDKNKN